MPQSPEKPDAGKSLENFKAKFSRETISEEEQEILLSQSLKKDFYEISAELEDFHGLFYQLWELGFPHLTFQLPTAAVAFNKEGRHIEFLFNPIFWSKLDLYTKAFICSHECLHVMLNHGLRIKDCPLPELANIALDVVVNHMLVNKFGFNRASIDLSALVEGETDEDGKPIPHRNSRGDDIVLCWLDTVFGKKYEDGEVKANKPFEYYYRFLEQNIEIKLNGKGKLILKGGSGGEEIGGNVLDDHSGLQDFDNEQVKEEIVDAINDKLSEEEKEEIHKKLVRSPDGDAAEKAAKKNGGKPGGKYAGSIAGSIVYRPEARNVQQKRKWETVIREWSKKFLKEEVTVEQWARVNRRIIDLVDGLMIPTDAEHEGFEEDKIDVYFFQDLSGSCWHLKDRFFRASQSLPKDRFNSHLHCFDTVVHKVTPDNAELHGGGGTSFSILENYIQQKIKSGEIPKYPDAVFVITDGYGDKVNPEKPENWYWFMSTEYHGCIPKESNIFPLKDFE